MDILTIGIIAAIAYFALQDGSESGSGFREQPAGYNPDVLVDLYQVGRNQAKIIFELKPVGKTFKVNRTAGSIYSGNLKLADFRDAKNFTVRGKSDYVTIDVVFPVEYTERMQDSNFWLSLRAIGDFEAKDKEKIKFENPIFVRAKEYPQQIIDFERRLG